MVRKKLGGYIKYKGCYREKYRGLWEYRGKVLVLRNCVFVGFFWFLGIDIMICFYRLCCFFNFVKKFFGEFFVLR